VSKLTERTCQNADLDITVSSAMQTSSERKRPCFQRSKKRRHLGADRPKERGKAKKQSVGATADVDVNATSCQTDDASITFL